MKSCLNCSHWKEVDLSTIFWLGTPPDYDCDIVGIEDQLPDPRKICAAALNGREARAEEVAMQCPHYEQSVDSMISASHCENAPNENFFRDSAETFMHFLGKLITEQPELNRGYRQGTGLGAPAPGKELNN